MDFRSNATELSVGPAPPVAFEYRCEAPFPYGLDATTFRALIFHRPMDASMFALVSPILAGDRLSAAFEAHLTLRPEGSAAVTVQQRGESEIRLA